MECEKWFIECLSDPNIDLSELLAALTGIPKLGAGGGLRPTSNGNDKIIIQFRASDPDYTPEFFKFFPRTCFYELTGSRFSSKEDLRTALVDVINNKVYTRG